MRTCFLVAFALALVTIATSIRAASIDEQQRRALEPLSSDGKSTGPTFLDSASIEASTSDTKVAVSIAGYLPKAPLGDYSLYQLGGQAPVSKGSEDDIDIGTLSGLTAGASANGSLSAMWWPHQTTAVTSDLGRVCDQEFRDLVPGYEWTEGSLTGEDFGCDRSLFSPEKLKKFVESINAARMKCVEYGEHVPASEDNKCTRLKAHSEARLTPDASDSKRLRRVLNRIDAVERRASPVTLLTLGAKVNRKKSNYFAESDFTKLTKNHSTGYGASITYSYLKGSRMLSGGFSLEKSYKSNSDVEVCSPIEGSTSLQCITGPIGEPTHTYARIVFAETRWLVVAERLAVAPRAEYDFTGSNYAVRLPIYIAPNKDKALTGGIAISYTDKDDEGFGASVFVGKAFSFF
jgi:hypothetical protein